MKRMCLAVLMAFLAVAFIAPVLAQDAPVYTLEITDNAADHSADTFDAYPGTFGVGMRTREVLVVADTDGDIEMFCVLNEKPMAIRKEESRQPDLGRFTTAMTLRAGSMNTLPRQTE